MECDNQFIENKKMFADQTIDFICSVILNLMKSRNNCFQPVGKGGEMKINVKPL